MSTPFIHEWLKTGAVVPVDIPTLTAFAAELRRLHEELERESDAIQRLWKERDELRSECQTLVRQNGEWQELNAELVEALRCADAMLSGANMDAKAVERKVSAALAKSHGIGEQHE